MWAYVVLGDVLKDAGALTAAEHAEVAGVVDALNALPHVDVAYPLTSVTATALARFRPDPSTDWSPSTPDLGASQRALFSAAARQWTTTHGIDVDVARTFPGGLGELAEVVLCDSPPLSHEDIPPYDHLRDNGYSGGDHGYQGHHASAGMGLLAASRNASGFTGQPYGFVGIAPEAGIGHVSLWGKQSVLSGDQDDFAGAISLAMRAMDEGGIMTFPHAQGTLSQVFPLEATDQVPITIDDATNDAVKTATANGRIVVLAGGNEDLELDYWDRFSPDNDSGGILVGGIDPATVQEMGGHARGEMIKVYSWHSEIPTTRTDHGNILDQGTGQMYGDWSGTSGASTIVAGAAALVQSIYRSTYGAVSLDSRSMRELLRRTGVPITSIYSTSSDPTDKTAVDLRAAIRSLDTLVWDFNVFNYNYATWTEDPTGHHQIAQMWTPSRGPCRRQLYWDKCYHLADPRCPDEVPTTTFGGRGVSLHYQPGVVTSYQCVDPQGDWTGSVANVEFPGDTTVEASIQVSQAPTGADGHIARKTDGSLAFGIEQGTGRLFYSYMTTYDVEGLTPAQFCRLTSPAPVVAAYWTDVGVVHDNAANTVVFYVGRTAVATLQACGPKAGLGGGLLEVGGGLEGQLDFLLLRSRVSSPVEISQELLF